MNYDKAAKLLYDSLGRKLEKRRLCNNTTLVRLSDGLLGVKLHSTIVLTYSPAGKFVVSRGCWHSRTTKDRINRFIPDGYSVFSDSSKYGASWILHYREDPVATNLATLDSEILDSEITVFPDGTFEGGGSVQGAFEECKKTRNARQRERYKLRYWILKARQGGKSRKPLTPALIQAEPNVTVRTAMIKVYGVERFLTDINAKVIDKEGEYELLAYPLNGWQSISALRMVCPSTKTVYIHPVPPNTLNVGAALDWMFDTPEFRTRLLSES